MRDLNPGVIKTRLDDGDCTLETVHRDNESILEQRTHHGIDSILIDEVYQDAVEKILEDICLAAGPYEL